MRQLVIRSAKSCRIDITREQLDLFSLKVLATACISVANASARTAVVIAFGKANLVSFIPALSIAQPPQKNLLPTFARILLHNTQMIDPI